MYVSSARLCAALRGSISKDKWRRRSTTSITGPPALGVKAPTTGFSSADIGHEFDASGKWVIKDSLVMNMGVALHSRNVVRENDYDAPLTLAYPGSRIVSK